MGYGSRGQLVLRKKPTAVLVQNRSIGEASGSWHERSSLERETDFVIASPRGIRQAFWAVKDANLSQVQPPPDPVQIERRDFLRV